MNILFDNNTPASLAYALRAHTVTRAAQLGRQYLENGRLLDAAERNGFEALITCDQSHPYQQNFTNRWPLIKPVAAHIARQVDFLQLGQVCRIDVLSL